jgi:hypothetical protein
VDDITGVAFFSLNKKFLSKENKNSPSESRTLVGANYVLAVTFFFTDEFSATANTVTGLNTDALTEGAEYESFIESNTIEFPLAPQATTTTADPNATTTTTRTTTTTTAVTTTTARKSIFALFSENTDF